MASRLVGSWIKAVTDMIMMAKEGNACFTKAAWSRIWRSGVGRAFRIVREAVDAKMTPHLQQGTWVQFGRRLLQDEDGIYIAIKNAHINCIMSEYGTQVLDQVHPRLMQQAAGQPVDPVPPPNPDRPRKRIYFRAHYPGAPAGTAARTAGWCGLCVSRLVAVAKNAVPCSAFQQPRARTHVISMINIAEHSYCIGGLQAEHMRGRHMQDFCDAYSFLVVLKHVRSSMGRFRV